MHVEISIFSIINSETGQPVHVENSTSSRSRLLYKLRTKILEREFSFEGFYTKRNSATNNLFYASVPDIPFPTLVPKYTPVPNPWKRVFKRVLNDLGNNVRSKINSFSEWIINHIPSQVKKPINKKSYNESKLFIQRN